jgi:hypothetical protein
MIKVGNWNFMLGRKIITLFILVFLSFIACESTNDENIYFQLAIYPPGIKYKDSSGDFRLGPMIIDRLLF